jgi:hypothetical protein
MRQHNYSMPGTKTLIAALVLTDEEFVEFCDFLVTLDYEHKDKAQAAIKALRQQHYVPEINRMKTTEPLFDKYGVMLNVMSVMTETFSREKTTENAYGESIDQAATLFTEDTRKAIDDGVVDLQKILRTNSAPNLPVQAILNRISKAEKIELPRQLRLKNFDETLGSFLTTYAMWAAAGPKPEESDGFMKYLRRLLIGQAVFVGHVAEMLKKDKASVE